MSKPLVAVLAALGLLLGAGAALPYGNTLLAPGRVLAADAVPDEASNEGPRVVLIAHCQRGPLLPLLPRHCGPPRAFLVDALTLGTSAAMRLRTAVSPAPTLFPVPCRC